MPDLGLPLDAVRDALPAVRDIAYLNTGGAGPLPVVAARAMDRAVAASLGSCRSSMAAYEAMMAGHAALRADVAAVLAAGEDEIALAGSSTGALNAALWGLELQPGDEVVTTDLEHPGLLAPLRVMQRRRGVVVRVVAAGGGADLEAAVAAASGPRTRVVALSHVSYANGAVLDVAGASRAARAAGALVVVDGAQGAGAVPTDPRDLGADAYAVAAHKWLLGPEGLGALWVRRETLEAFSPTSAGIGSGTEHAPDGTFTPHPDARRLEVSTLPEVAVPGWRASLGWLGGLGWGAVHARIAAGVARARTTLEGVPGVTVVTPPGREAGLLVFSIAGVAPDEADAALVRQGVVGRWVPHPPGLRVSIGFFWNDADLARLGAAVALIASGG